MENGKKRNRSGRPGYQGAWLIGALVCLTVVGDCGAAEGMFEGMFNKLGLSGAAKMSDVAVKIAEIKDSINVNGLDFSPDGKHLATSSYAQSNEVHVWDWQARKIVLKVEAEGGAGLISEGIRYSPDGRFLAVCHDRSSKPHIIHVFDARSGQLVKEVNDPIPGGCSAIGFTPDGEWMLRITRRGPIRGDNLIVYSTRTWEPTWGVVTDPMDTNAMTISPDGRYVAIGGIDLGPGVPHQPRILIVDLQQRQVVKSIATFPIDNAVKRVAWSPDGTQIAAGAIVGGTSRGPDVVKIFDAKTGQQTLGEPVVEQGHIRTLRYSPDGKYLAEGQIDDKIRIWDGQHKTLLQEIPIDDHGMNLVFSGDGKFMAITNGGTKVQVWKLK
jgi:WD40 repeat protein